MIKFDQNLLTNRYTLSRGGENFFSNMIFFFSMKIAPYFLPPKSHWDVFFIFFISHVNYYIYLLILQWWPTDNRHRQLHFLSFTEGTWKGWLHQDTQWCEWCWGSHVSDLGKGCGVRKDGPLQVCCCDLNQCCQDIQHLS